MSRASMHHLLNIVGLAMEKLPNCKKAHQPSPSELRRKELGVVDGLWRQKIQTKHSRVPYYPPANLRVDICAPKFIDFGNQASPWYCFCQGRRGSCGSKCSRFATSLGLGTAKFKSHIGSIMTRQSTPLGLLELWKKLSSYQLCSIYFWR